MSQPGSGLVRALLHRLLFLSSTALHRLVETLIGFGRFQQSIILAGGNLVVHSEFDH